MRLLDLFCGAGGAATGYHRAGFDEIVGVDIEPQPDYPFEFVQGNALEYPTDGFDAIHASPPCQRYARIGYVHGIHKNHEDLIGPTEELLKASGALWVIENVPDSKMRTSYVLCGSMFGLGSVGELDGVYRQLRRHRLFQSNVVILTPQCNHNGEPVGVYGRGGPQRASRNRGYMGGTRERIEAMGIDWMSRDELSQAIPPAYTEYIGKHLMAHLRRKTCQNDPK